MADSRDPFAPLLYKLTCPICHELEEWEVGDEPRRVACGFCGTQMTCPPRALVQQLQYRPPDRTPDEIGSYSLHPQSAAELVGGGASGGFSFSLPCPQCGESVGTRLEERAKRVTCPECGGDVVVPSRNGSLQVATRPPSEAEPADLPAGSRGGDSGHPGPHLAEEVESAARAAVSVSPGSETPPAAGPVAGVTPAPVLPLTPGVTVFDQLARIRQVELAAPPVRTFFSGVFDFPWQRATLPRWGLQAFGLSLLAALLVGGQMAVAGMSGPALGLILGCFALPGIWIGLWSLSYSAANFLAVVEATSAGATQVDEWPEPNWREWLLQLVYLGWLAAFPGAIAWLVTQVAGVSTEQRPRIALGLLATLYPVVLMSALEANSPWWPLSRRVAISLWRFPGAWLLFYLLTGGLLAMGGVLVSWAWGWPSLWLALACGPVWSALNLIVARLFGRLAWKISGIESRWSRKRREAAVEAKRFAASPPVR